jgi:uncharacterized membrane protein YgdD (TMEM256/DUF423 family)
MSGRFWIVIGAILGGLSVAVGAIGAHVITDTEALPGARSIFNTGQLYHALHALALIAVGIVLFQSEGWRARFSTVFLHAACLAFLTGIICFSGGIYVQVWQGLSSSGGVTPFGGVAFMVGWAAFALGALGLRA